MLTCSLSTTRLSMSILLPTRTKGNVSGSSTPDCSRNVVHHPSRLSKEGFLEPVVVMVIMAVVMVVVVAAVMGEPWLYWRWRL